MQNEVLRASLQTQTAGPHGALQTLEKISLSELAQIDRRSTLVAKIPARGDCGERASIETMKARASSPTPTLEKQAEQPSGYDIPLPPLTLAEAVMTPKSSSRSSSLDTSLDGELMSPQVSAWSPVDPKVAAAMATAPVPQTSESSSFASIFSTRGGLKTKPRLSNLRR